MADRTLTALYRSKDLAEHAKTQLKNAGLDHVDVHSDDQDSLTETARAAGEKTRNFFERVADFFGGHEDTHAYAEGVRRGNYLLTAKVDEGRADEAHRLLDATDALNIEEEQQSWRSQGWGGRYEGNEQGAAARSDSSLASADESGADTRGTAGVHEAYQGTSSSGVFGAGATAGGLTGAGVSAPDTTGSSSAEADRAQAGATDSSTGGRAGGAPGEVLGTASTPSTTGSSLADTDRAQAADATYNSTLSGADAASTGIDSELPLVGSPSTASAQSSASIATSPATGSAGATNAGQGTTESDQALERVTDGDDHAIAFAAVGGRSMRRDDTRESSRIRSYVVEGSAEEPGDYQAGGRAAETASEGALGEGGRIRTGENDASTAETRNLGQPGATNLT